MCETGRPRVWQGGGARCAGLLAHLLAGVAAAAPADAPPAGPDSTSRTGNSAADSSDMIPPPECIRKTGQAAPSAASRSRRRPR